MRGLRQFWERYLGNEWPPDLSAWHRASVIFPVRTTDGQLTFGLVWRRFLKGKWEYKEREETADEFYDRQY